MVTHQEGRESFGQIATGEQLVDLDLYWRQPIGGLACSQRERYERGEFIWVPEPMNIYVGKPPQNSSQEAILEKLRLILTDEDIGCRFVNRPDERTELGANAKMVINCGNGTLSAEPEMLEIYRDLPDPKGTVFGINTVDSLPPVTFDVARHQLVNKASHNGIVCEVKDGVARRVLWGSMQGNYKVIEGPQDEIFNNLALRILTHYGVEMTTVRVPHPTSFLTWGELASSTAFPEMSEAAWALGEAGIIEDRVNLLKYSDPERGDLMPKAIQFALNKNGLGESMRSVLDPKLGIMLVTRSGGGKVNLSAIPEDGHLVPVSKITNNGYVCEVPLGCPIEFSPPSVETFENGVVYYARALAQESEGFIRELDERLRTCDSIHIMSSSSEGRRQKEKMFIDHFHRGPDPGSFDPCKVETVYPDFKRFPKMDFPCGSKWAAMMLLSAFYNSKTFVEGGSLEGKVIIALLPGHGSVSITSNRRFLTEVLTKGMKMREPERV